jgi:hypothetical protein
MKTTREDIEKLGAFATVVGTVWAITDVVFNSSKITNDSRDAVINGTELTTDHKWMIVWNDWAPITAWVLFLCLAGIWVLWNWPDKSPKWKQWLGPKRKPIAIVLLVVVGYTQGVQPVQEFLLMKKSIEESDPCGNPPYCHLVATTPDAVIAPGRKSEGRAFVAHAVQRLARRRPSLNASGPHQRTKGAIAIAAQWVQAPDPQWIHHQH